LINQLVGRAKAGGLQLTGEGGQLQLLTSLGDLLSQTHDAGGLGLGTTATSLLFLITIISLVTYLSTRPRPHLDRA
jgi:hypothetical protein